MGKIKKIEKARGEYKCSKCGEAIHKGDSYLRGERFRMKPLIACTKCGIKSYELSQSDYVQRVGAVCEEWETMYGVSEDTPASICEELESLRDDLQDRLDNMPENLRENSETGQLLQERIDTLEDTISELENIDIENLRSEARDQAEVNLEPEEGDEAPTEEAIEEETSDLFDESVRQAIEEALGTLEY